MSEQEIETVVFVGPSCPEVHHWNCSNAKICSPIKRGDIAAIMKNFALQKIAVIDGCFFTELSVSPKEILHALEAGIEVYGSSSIGALRAVELRRYGMRGVGAVYGMFASGEVESDDEVAMVFDPVTLKALSDPLINMRCAMKQAVACRICNNAFADELISSAKALYFPERTYSQVLKKLSQRYPSEADSFVAFLEREKPDQKCTDALELLSACGVQQ